jgi:proline iminopeptidase
MTATCEGYIPVEGAELYYREVGGGKPIIVLHGGMDLDHTYFLPDLDRLADSYRLICYDQRGRGKSVGDVEEISIESEMRDLDAVREYFGVDSVALLGHSWSGVLVMEYTIHHPERVSKMILMATGPASRDDFQLYSQEWARRRASHEEELRALKNSAAYKEGDPKALAAWYRIYFSTTIKEREHLDRLNLSMEGFTKESVLRGWAIEDRLFDETWGTEGYDLIPKLKELSNPTLLIHGDYDFVPVKVASHIAQAIPRARLVVLKGCGHFPYLERPEDFHIVIDDFFAAN